HNLTRMICPGQRLRSRLNALEKVFRLDSQRLFERNSRNMDVPCSMDKTTRRNPIERVCLRVLPTIDAFVIDYYLVVGDIIVDYHFLAPDNRNPAHLVRIEPANMYVGS